MGHLSIFVEKVLYGIASELPSRIKDTNDMVDNKFSKSRELDGNVGCVGPWVRGLSESNFNVGCMGYVGGNIFYMGQHFTWVIIFIWVAWVKFFSMSCVGPKFLCGSNFSVFCVSQVLFTR